MGPSHLEIWCSTFFILSVLLFSSSCFIGCVLAEYEHEPDRAALKEFKGKLTDDPLGVTSSWNESLSICQWPGVTCGRRHKRVTVLNLQSSKLAGSISPGIGNLSFLRELQLQNNSFVGEIPSEVGRLRRLEILRLFNNSIVGNIPSNISGCSNLRSISLAGNRLDGEIPAEFGYLGKLNFVSMTRNNLHGEIPPSFGNLSSLQILSLTENMFTGLPDTLGQLRNLTYAAFGGNQLTGTIPSSLFNLSSLTLFNIVGNQIHGSLPSDTFIALPNIEYFGIAMNQITGTIPISITNASTVQRLQLTQNRLSGKIPSLEKLHKLRWFHTSSNLHGTGGVVDDLDFICSLTNASNFEELAVNNNNLGGALPECLGDFSSTFTKLLMRQNKITGIIPTSFRNLSGLQVVDLGRNRLSGNIPLDIGNLEKLVLLSLYGNKLSGNLPSSVGSLKKLTKLYLHDNNLQGSIPPSLGECQSLVLLDLSVNNLRGNIPVKVFSLTSLSIYLNLSWNRLSGLLPVEVRNLKNLGMLDVSENMLSQTIPSSLGSCTRLEILNMQGNFFIGTVPSSLSSLRGIEQLDLSRNNLSGQIPEFLEGFNFLRKLNMSFNNLEGSVPTSGVFMNASAFSILGNNKLCGGISELNLPKCSTKNSKKKKLPIVLKVTIGAVSGIFVVCILLSLLCFFWLRMKKKGMQRKEDLPDFTENLLPTLSYQSLLKATDSFSLANLVGTGSFGSVYKGILDTDGTLIAVKVLNLQNCRASESFIAECNVLKNVRHRNLVRLLTACSSVDCSGNDFKALVYEFMPNGSLEDWLHPVAESNNNTEKTSRVLSLFERLDIGIDIAHALDYLHNHCNNPVIHCDIKPGNVLLDNEMTGHLSDFGLAKIFSESSVSSIGDQSFSVGIRGTIGYTAPEYGLGSGVTKYADAYSYGILLLEMFTGRRPIDDEFNGSFNLHNFVVTALPERVTEIVDPTIVVDIVEDSSIDDSQNHSNCKDSKIRECLVSIFEIGVACSMELPRERKSIDDVLAKLHLVREELTRRLANRQTYRRSLIDNNLSVPF